MSAGVKTKMGSAGVGSSLTGIAAMTSSARAKKIRLTSFLGLQMLAISSNIAPATVPALRYLYWGLHWIRESIDTSDIP